MPYAADVTTVELNLPTAERRARKLPGGSARGLRAGRRMAIAAAPGDHAGTIRAKWPGFARVPYSCCCSRVVFRVRRIHLPTLMPDPDSMPDSTQLSDLTEAATTRRKPSKRWSLYSMTIAPA